MLVEMFQSLYGKINPYALDYPLCTEKKHKHKENVTPREGEVEMEVGVGQTAIHSRRLDDGSDTASSQVVKLINSSTAGGPPFLPTEDVYRPCAEEHLNAYLNREDVKKALHVSPLAPERWKECSNIVEYNNKDFSTSIVDLYKDLIGKAIEHDIEVFIFSGDDDSVCSTAGTQWWIWDLGVAPMADKLWKRWKVEDQTVGFVTKFELGVTNATFTFATVHGAGHEVSILDTCREIDLVYFFIIATTSLLADNSAHSDSCSLSAILGACLPPHGGIAYVRKCFSWQVVILYVF